MLVGNKFIYISLPRCASTSFMVSCIKQDISLNHYNNHFDKQLGDVDSNTSSEELTQKVKHVHEKCSDLITKFGNEHNIVSIKRDRHQRFLSTWEHCLDMLYRKEEYDIFNKLKYFNENDIFQFTKFNVNSLGNINNLVDSFILKNDLVLSNVSNLNYLRTILSILFSPTSLWHEHNPNILWFDFKDLNRFEDWVSETLDKPFKLEKTNSSKHIECNLKLTDGFVERYNSIYDVYDFNKITKTLI